MKSGRRWLQFSLRGIFVVMTIGCLWLASIARIAIEEREALEMIRQANGDVVYEPTLFSKIGLGQGRPTVLSFPFSHAEDIDFAKLPCLRTLKRLDLRGTRTQDVHLRHLHTMKCLQIIELSRTEVSRKAVDRLQRSLPGTVVGSDFWCGGVQGVMIVETVTTVEDAEQFLDPLSLIQSWQPPEFEEEAAEEKAALLDSLGPSLVGSDD